MKQSTWFSLIFIVIVGASILLICRDDSLKRENSELSTKHMNAFMHGLNVIQYDLKGNIQISISAPISKHYPKDDLLYLSHPKVIVYTEDRIPWDISADYGNSTHNHQIVKLWGHVKLHQPENQHSVETTIDTEALTFYPKKSLVLSDEKVSIAQPGSLIEGRGINADLKNGIIQLLSQSRGRYAGKK